MVVVVVVVVVGWIWVGGAGECHRQSLARAMGGRRPAATTTPNCFRFGGTTAGGDEAIGGNRGSKDVGR